MSVQSAAAGTHRVQPMRRVFPRGYPAEAISSIETQQAALSAAVDERRQMTLRRIGDLKASLASIVSSSRESSEDGRWPGATGRDRASLETIRKESPEVPRRSSLPLRDAQHGAALSTSPSLFRHGSDGGTNREFLREAQRQVERLTQVNHDLVQRCLEQEARIQDLEDGAAAAAGAHRPATKDAAVAVRSPTDAGDDAHSDAAGSHVQQSCGHVKSPREAPFFARYGIRTESSPPLDATAGAPGQITTRSEPSSQQGDEAAAGSLPAALHGLLHRASVCYPELFDGLAPPTATEGGSAPIRVEELSEQGVSEALWRMENVIPGLISSSRLGDLFTDAGAELLERINTLEDEKQTDYFKVLDITEKLIGANAALKAQDVQMQERLKELGGEVEGLRRQRGELVDQLAAERVAHVAALEEERQRHRTAEAAAAKAKEEAVAAAVQRAVTDAEGKHAEEVAALQHLLGEERVSSGVAAERCAAAEAALSREEDERRAASEGQEGRLRELEQRLEEKRLEVERQATAIAAAMKHVAALTANADAEAAQQKEKDAQLLEIQTRHEALLGELEEAKAEAAALAERLEERASVNVAETNVPAADGELQRQLEALTEERDALAQQLATAAQSKAAAEGGAAPLDSTLLSDGDEPTEEVSMEDAAATSPSSAEFRKTKQSLKRMTHERTALRRKLERQGVLLAEAQGKLEEAELEAKTLATEIATMRMASEKPPQRGRPAAEPICDVALIDFGALEDGAAGGAAEVYPPPAAPLVKGAATLSLAAATAQPSLLEGLDDDARLEVEAGGPLYNIGLVAAQRAGLDTAPPGMVWRRLFLQAQRTIEARRSPALSSTYAAACARLHYSLLDALGLLAAERVGAPAAWALVVAGVCHFVGPAADDEAGEEEEEEDRKAEGGAVGGALRWRAVERILSHVEDESARDGRGSLYAAFAGSGAGAEAAQAREMLRSLLLSEDDLPRGDVDSCVAHRLVLLGCAIGPISAETALAPAELLTVGQLCLRLSRDAGLLAPSYAAQQLKDLSRALLSRPPATDNTVDEGGKDTTVSKAAGGRLLLLYLDGTLLPLALAASRLLSGRSTAGADLLADGLVQVRVAVADASTATLGISATPEEWIARLKALFCGRAGSAVDEAELLQLYNENATYRVYVEKLLAAIEAQQQPLMM